MKIKAINGLNTGSLLATLLFLFAAALANPVHAASEAPAAKVFNMSYSTGGKVINNTYALRCYKRCYVDRYGRHCRSVCN